MVPKGGFARLSLAPRAVRCGVPQGAQFIREWGGPSMAPASAAGFGPDALPCVALFLPDRSAPQARSNPPRAPNEKKKGGPGGVRGPPCFLLCPKGGLYP